MSFSRFALIENVLSQRKTELEVWPVYRDAAASYNSLGWKESLDSPSLASLQSRAKLKVGRGPWDPGPMSFEHLQGYSPCSLKVWEACCVAYLHLFSLYQTGMSLTGTSDYCPLLKQ